MLSERDRIFLKKALTYANGYRELTMFDEALEELDRLGDRFAAEKEILQMKLAILMEAKRWLDALPVANRLASNDSSDPGNLVNLAYVTRRAENLEGARVILEHAARRFPDEAIIHYNLGCYSACSGDLDTAKKFLVHAFRLDPQYLKMGASDSDLAALKNWIRSLHDS